MNKNKGFEYIEDMYATIWYGFISDLYIGHINIFFSDILRLNLNKIE
jgi:hypothetical protein